MSVYGRDGAGQPSSRAVDRPQVPGQRDRSGSEESERVPSDADLIERMRAGEDTAYEELYRRHGDVDMAALADWAEAGSTCE